MPTPNIARFAYLDALRGFAMLWMAVFHFCFDLNQYGYIRQDFYHSPIWTWQRIAIVSVFLFCAGLSLSLSLAQQTTWRQFGKRLAQIAGCAVLVSIGSYWMFPNSYISFGILHGIVLMLLLARLLAPCGRWLWLIGLVALLLPYFVQHSWFDSRATNWIGLITHKPITEDYAPLLPWLGVVLWGLATGQYLLRIQHRFLSASLPHLLKPLAQLGRYALRFYMLHQPVLIGLLMLLALL